MESVSSRGEGSENYSLYFPPEKDVESVDDILYDLVEGVSLMVMSDPIQL